jgi:hypothetical protein
LAGIPVNNPNPKTVASSEEEMVRAHPAGFSGVGVPLGNLHRRLPSAIFPIKTLTFLPNGERDISAPPSQETLVMFWVKYKHIVLIVVS